MIRLPRLSRKQRVVRNLLVGLAACGIIWYGFDFAPPTAGLALRWKAQTYLLEETPELLYTSPAGKNGSRELVGRCGERWFYCRDYQTLLFHDLGNLTFTEPTEPVTCIIPPFGGEDVLYIAAQIPGAARAACSVRFQSTVSVAQNDTTSIIDLDETYSAQSEANPQGIYRFPLERKYEDALAPLRTAEWATFHAYSCIPEQTAGLDLICTVHVTFYGEDGRELMQDSQTFQAEAEATQSTPAEQKAAS